MDSLEFGRSSPYGSLYRDMIVSASRAQASDVHIQPEQDGVDIRFRIHGELARWKWIPGVHKTAFLQEAKQLSHCSLAVAGRAQDARISLHDQKLDVRVNLVPSLHGEKIVLRLLDQSREFDLTRIGLPLGATQAIRRALDHRTGVNLITGPTGSGKTTLLYSALAALDRGRLNIVTIEDPVEYTFPGVTQVQVTPKLAFADALRAMLRQDPDVILLGEVRDTGTAELCFQAASTGHLVLSTLHANNASEVKRRLAGMGVQADLMDSCLRFSSAQRLVPRLCAACALPLTAEDRKRGMKLIGDPAVLRRRNPSGCDRCVKGITSRLPVFEYIDWERERESEGGGHSPGLREAALELARKGEVDAFDALQLE